MSLKIEANQGLEDQERLKWREGCIPRLEPKQKY